MMLHEYLSLLLPEIKWPEGMHQKSQQSWEGQVCVAYLLPHGLESLRIIDAVNYKW